MRQGRSSLKKKVFGVSDWRDELKTEVSLERSHEEPQQQASHLKSSHLRSGLRNTDPRSVRIRQELARPSKVASADAAQRRGAHHGEALQPQRRCRPGQAPRAAAQSRPAGLAQSHQQQVAVPHQVERPPARARAELPAPAAAGPLPQDLRDRLDAPAAGGQPAGPDPVLAAPAETRPGAVDGAGRRAAPADAGRPGPAAGGLGRAAAARRGGPPAAQARPQLRLCAGLPAVPGQPAAELRELPAEDAQRQEPLRGAGRRLPGPAPLQRLLPRGHARVRAQPPRLRSSR
jgi:hypothetical protein